MYTLDNSDGLGLDEYFGWCEDLNMEPILAVWDGYYLDGPATSEDDIGAYVQDAMNELEYIMGDESTPYGGLRCTYGHTEPYELHYVEIGNEDNLGGGLPTYAAYRYKVRQLIIDNIITSQTGLTSYVTTGVLRRH